MAAGEPGTLHEPYSPGDREAVVSFFTDSHPATAAEVLATLPHPEARDILRLLDGETRAEVFSHLELENQGEIITLLRRPEVAALLTDMSPDDRVDLLKSLPEDRREDILPAMAQAEREDIRRLTAYEEGTVGAVMTSDYAFLKQDLTAFKAIEKLRQVAPDRETIYSAYVVDAHRRLLGYVSLKDLILAGRSQSVGDIMSREVISVRVSDDQEEAARTIQKYDLMALPVVDDSDALVGIVTHDDALDIITQEHTEDMEKLMAIVGSHEASAYLKTGTLEHFRNRSVWILSLAALGMISGYIVHAYEGLLFQFAILVAFMPMLAAAGGNTGSQAAAMVIRALALKEISHREMIPVLFKELRISMLLGLVLGGLAFARVILFGGGSSFPESHSLSLIGLAIAAALGIQVVVSTLAGAVLPMGIARFRLDPAVVASPAITSIVDISGLLIYFTTVKLILGIQG